MSNSKRSTSGTRWAARFAAAGMIGVVLALLASAAPARSRASGPWHWSAELRRDGRVEMRLTQESPTRHWRSEHTEDLSAFRGITRRDFEGPRRDMTFSQTRDAGTMRFEGRVGDGQGTGTARFEPDPGFRDALREHVTGEVDDDMQFAMFVHDVSLAEIRELARLGYDHLQADEVLAFRIHGVRAAWIREMRALGLKDLDPDELVAMRIHGVTPQFVRETRARSDQVLDADDLVAMRIHGVTPELRQQMAALGYRNVSADDLLACRIHGASPEFIREVEGLGYDHPSLDDAVAMRIHGVTPEFIREAEGLGYHHVDLDDLVAMRIHGVTPEFIREAQKRYGRGIGVQDLLELKIVGRRGRHGNGTWRGERR